jgi:hypothetical protein
LCLETSGGVWAQHCQQDKDHDVGYSKLTELHERFQS